MIKAELLRFRSRRLNKWMTIFFIVALLFSALLVFFNTSDEAPIGGQPANATFSIEEIKESPEFHECMESNGFGTGGEDAPTLEDFCTNYAMESAFQDYSDDRFIVADMDEIVVALAFPIVLFLMFLGASFIGAEWQKGTMTTTLTWETRRGVVFGSKLAAVAIGSAALFVLLQLAFAVALLPSMLLHGVTDGLTASWWQSFGETFARCLAVAVCAGVLGMSIASLGRNTAAALGVVFAYFAIVENLVRSWKPGWQQWLLGDNLTAFLNDEVLQDMGMNHSATTAGLVALFYVGLIAAVAYAVFQARDVT